MTLKAFALALVLAAFALWPHASLAQAQTLNPPTNLHIYLPQDNAAEYRVGITKSYTFRWDRPSNGQGGSMTYIVTITDDDGTTIVTTTFGSTDYSNVTYTHTLSMPAAKEDREAFTLSVTARQGVYNDSTAATKTFLLPRIVPPTLFHVTHLDSGGATLDWDPPYNLDSSETPSYSVEVRGTTSANQQSPLTLTEEDMNAPIFVKTDIPDQATVKGQSSLWNVLDLNRGGCPDCLQAPFLDARVMQSNPSDLSYKVNLLHEPSREDTTPFDFIGDYSFLLYERVDNGQQDVRHIHAVMDDSFTDQFQLDDPTPFVEYRVRAVDMVRTPSVSINDPSTHWSAPLILNLDLPPSFQPGGDADAAILDPPSSATEDPTGLIGLIDEAAVRLDPDADASDWVVPFVFMLALGAGAGVFVVVARSGSTGLAAAAGGLVSLIVWSGLGPLWFGVPWELAYLPLILVILGGFLAVTKRMTS